MSTVPRGSTYRAEILRWIHSHPGGDVFDDQIGVAELCWQQLGQRSGEHRASTAAALTHLVQAGLCSTESGYRHQDGKKVRVRITALVEPPTGTTLYHPREYDTGQRGPSIPDLTPDQLLQALEQLSQLVHLPLRDLQGAAEHVEHLSAENAELYALAEDIEIELANERRALSASRRQVANLQAQVQQLQQDMATAQDVDPEVYRQMQHYKARSADHWRRIVRYGQQVSELHRTISHQSDQIATLNQVVSDRDTIANQLHLAQRRIAIATRQAAAEATAELEKKFQRQADKVKQTAQQVTERNEELNTQVQYQMRLLQDLTKANVMLLPAAIAGIHRSAPDIYDRMSQIITEHWGDVFGTVYGWSDYIDGICAEPADPDEAETITEVRKQFGALMNQFRATAEAEERPQHHGRVTGRTKKRGR